MNKPKKPINNDKRMNGAIDELCRTWKNLVSELMKRYNGDASKIVALLATASAQCMVCTINELSEQKEEK